MKAEINNSRLWVDQSDAAYLKKSLDDLLKVAGFRVLGFLDHAFEPFGYTGMWLLAESHCAVHTFPEKGTAYVELSSCNQIKHDVFMRHLKDQFNVFVVED